MIESPNSVVQRYGHRLMHFQISCMALRFTVMGFLASERGMRRNR